MEIEETENSGKCKRFRRWIKLVWKMKSMYLSGLVHIYDIATDVGVIIDWGQQAFAERRGGAHDVRGVNMMAFFVTSIVVFCLYRLVSAVFVYEFSGKFTRCCMQCFGDLEIYRAIYVSHKLKKQEPGNLQRLLQKLEVLFESTPQALYVTHYKNSKYLFVFFFSI